MLKVQKMLHFCNDHLDPTKEDDTFQMFAVLGIALIAMGEDVGAEMSLRAFNHLVGYELFSLYINFPNLKQSLNKHVDALW